MVKWKRGRGIDLPTILHSIPNCHAKDQRSPAFSASSPRGMAPGDSGAWTLMPPALPLNIPQALIDSEVTISTSPNALNIALLQTRYSKCALRCPRGG